MISSRGYHASPSTRVDTGNPQGQRSILSQHRKGNRHFRRYRQIALVLVKHRLGELIRALGLERFLPLRWVLPGNPWRKSRYTQPERTRMALEELGTTFVKVGQILSTRSDLLPSDFIRELAKLQTALQPLPVEVIKKVISDELGRPVSEVFPFFDPVPLGVASIGQAHAASLPDGTPVVVKARKPGVVEQVAEDMDILRQLAENAARRWEYSQMYDLSGIVEEIAETITAELDYVREGHNAEHFLNFFQEDPSVHIPKVFWQYTTTRVITLERITGLGILEVSALDKAGFDRKDLARRSANIWLKMIFEDAVFHADPHPGNLFVENDGRLGLIDFGMVGTVDGEIREQLASAIKGILERNVDLVVDSLVDLGAVPRGGSRENLRADLKHLMGHYPLSVKGQHLAGNLSELFSVVRRSHVQLPSNTFLLLKTVGMVQSLGQGLDPDFDLYPLIAENGERAIKTKYSPGTLVRRLPSAALDMAVLAVGLPQRLNRLVKSVERGDLRIQTDVSGLELHLEHLERVVNRMIIGLITAAVILGATVLILAFRLGS